MPGAGKHKIVIPNVEIFQAGEWQGDTYSEQDLDNMVENWHRFSSGSDPLVHVPAVVGHEEEQELLKNTGIPAVGWVVGLRRKGRSLFADISQVFPEIARLVEAGAYKHVSSEIYPSDSPPEGVPGVKGTMLRRVALLGGSLPHIKQLRDLPQPVYKHSERFKSPRVDLTPEKRVWEDSSRTWACFSEVRRVRAMADDAVEQVAMGAIMAAFPGLPPDLVESLTPDQMAMMASAMPSAMPAADEAMPPEDGAMPMAEWPEGMDRAAVMEALVANGQDPAALEGMSDDELIAMYQTMLGGAAGPAPDMMAEFPPPMEDSTVTTPTPQATPASKRLPKKLTTTAQFSEEQLEQAVTRAVAKIITPFRQEVQSARKAEQRRLKETHRERVRAFCEVLRQNGQVSPAEVDFDTTTGQPLGPVALSLMLASPVKKFSETESDFDRLIASYKKLPARKFGEQVPDPIQNNRDTMTQDRRDYLLGLTSRGKAVLQKESAQKQSAKMFAEVIGDALKGHLNGK